MIGQSTSRRVIACAVTLLMCVMSVLAVCSDGFSWWRLLLALVLSFGAGLFFLIDVRFPRWLSVTALFVLPFGALVCMECFTHVPWDLAPLILLLNYLFYLILYLLFTAITGNIRWGCLFAPLLPAIVGTVNFYVVSFRSSPFVPWDLFSVRTAMSVAGNYDITMSWRLFFVLAGFLWLMLIGEKARFSIKGVRKRLASCGVSVVLMAGFLFYVQTGNCERNFGLDTTLFTPNVLYRNNGFMVAWLANLQYLNLEKPEGYSEQAAQAIADETPQEESTDGSAEEMPNLIVIMNESFSDLSVYGDFEVTEDYLPFWNSLNENTVRGSLYVSVKGGNTANTEFEFLTGNTMAFLPTGSVPYQQFLNDDMPSLASYLGSLGYQTAALHPYYSTGWNRDQVYEEFGFEEQYFRDTDGFPNASLLRGWVDDASAFDRLIELYEEKEEGTPLFAFEVTMQNHGGYSQEYDDLTNEVQFTDLPTEFRTLYATQTKATENYLTLIKKSDEAFSDLISYFSEQEEKTIVLMFGDHQPSEYVSNTVLRLLGEDVDTRNDSAKSLAASYEVPFVLWANYDIEEKEVEAISANYLGALLLETAGLPLTGYQTFLLDLSETWPVITANFYIDTSGTVHPWSEREAIETLSDYAILQYNDLVDTKKRLSSFFDG